MAARGDVLIATETFTFEEQDGTPIIIRKDVTRVRAGHPIARRFAQYFKPIDVHYQLEEMTDEPGRKRGER